MKNLKVIIALFLLSCLACEDNKGNEMEKSLSGYVATGVNIRIVDSNGNDRLAPNSQNGLSKFKLYYLINGQKQIYNNPAMTASGGYNIKKFDPGNYYYLQVFLNSPKPDETDTKERTTYLEFEDGSTDTIKATYDIKPGYIAIDETWYNSKLQVYRREPDSLRVILLLKP